MPIQITKGQRDELTLWHIEGEFGRACIAEQGAQLIDYTPRHHYPVIWLSDQAQFHQQQSIRGGIPLCWPWFGVLTKNPDAIQGMLAPKSNNASHGFIRHHRWQRDPSRDTASGLGFKLSVTPETYTNWAHHAELRILFDFNDGLLIHLSTLNTNPYPIHISQALHSYFNVSDCQTISIEGLQHKPYIDTLRDWQRDTSEHNALRLHQGVDRIYLNTDTPLVIRDPNWQREIQIQSTNSRSAVIWNPWSDKAHELSQFSADAWRTMLCIETANIWDDTVTLISQEQHTLSAHIKVVST